MTDSHNTDEMYEDHPMHEPYNKLSVTVNNKEFLLTGKFLSRIERLANSSFEENEFVELSWRVAGPDEEDHEAGDPVLCIETCGPMVPWDQLSEMEMEMAPAGQGPPKQQDTDTQDADSQKDTDDVDNGNGTAAMDPSQSPTGSDGQAEPPAGGEGPDDFKLVMTPEQMRVYPDPEDNDYETMPPAPEEYPDDEPELVVPIPEYEHDERWSTGEAITGTRTYTEWNVQKKMDQPRYDSFLDKQRNNSHDHWEGLLRYADCPVIGEMKPKNRPDPDEKSGEEKRKGWDYDEKDNDPDSNAVGSRYQL